MECCLERLHYVGHSPVMGYGTMKGRTGKNGSGYPAGTRRLKMPCESLSQTGLYGPMSVIRSFPFPTGVFDRVMHSFECGAPIFIE